MGWPTRKHVGYDLVISGGKVIPGGRPPGTIDAKSQFIWSVQPGGVPAPRPPVKVSSCPGSIGAIGGAGGAGGGLGGIGGDVDTQISKPTSCALPSELQLIVVPVDNVPVGIASDAEPGAVAGGMGLL